MLPAMRRAAPAAGGLAAEARPRAPAPFLQRSGRCRSWATQRRRTVRRPRVLGRLQLRASSGAAPAGAAPDDVPVGVWQYGPSAYSIVRGEDGVPRYRERYPQPVDGREQAEGILLSAEGPDAPPAPGWFIPEWYTRLDGGGVIWFRVTRGGTRMQSVYKPALDAPDDTAAAFTAVLCDAAQSGQSTNTTLSRIRNVSAWATRIQMAVFAVMAFALLADNIEFGDTAYGQ
eukprot:TRINITY_DN21926_c0_g1_i1.p1 TRINITY_DN21926_c0_g1~~TRINITY_DN21926_c0_g1_i1.p1  ORF type:complete len:252 (+),score=49.80 TRINITY_DN21926_c0_g1_i1:67-756(+)